MRVFVNTSGSHGDVNPFIGIARVLADRGHEIVFFTHPYYSRDLAAAGLEHVPVGADVDHESVLRDLRLMHPRKGSVLVMKMIADAAPGAIEILRREIRSRRPDVFLAHHVCVGSRWVCEEAEVPLAIAILCPLFWFARGDPVPAPQRQTGRLSELRARALLGVMRSMIPWIADRWINRLRRRVGLPRERGTFLRDTHGGKVNLGMWSPSFRGPAEDDPPAGRICGFSWYDGAEADAELEPDLESFLDDDEPPIVFTLGSAAVYSPGDFYELAARACAKLGRRGVLLTGPRVGEPPRLPDSVRAFGFAPYSKLLPLGCATVHHGGLGSTAQALRAGRPMVVVPHAHDQFNNAVRVAKLGAGRLVHRHRLTVDRLADALRAVLDDPGMSQRCSELGRKLSDEDGALAAADAIEGLLAAGLA